MMMESVGAVDSGDNGPLPDFSHLEQAARLMRIAGKRESSHSFPACPQAVDSVRFVPITRWADRLEAGSESFPVLVVSALP